jgi:uncharacterized protein YgbK (DUF1537 family)
VTVGTETAAADVIDLGTRARSEQQAVERLRAVGDVRAHKIDSTLRGHWVAEVRELASRRRVLIVPAAPALGRTCVNGVVHVHGRPLEHGDVLAHLPEARWLAGPDAVDGWLQWGSGIAVAATPPAAEQWASVAGDAVIVGPAAAIGATLRPSGHRIAALPRTHGGSVIVVCGSVAPVAREQLAAIDAAVAAGRLSRVEVFATDLDVDAGRGELRPEVVHALVAELDLRADLLVLVGGDTAAAVLGDAPRSVGGYAALGMPWSRAVESRGTSGDGPLVITKAGSFGTAESLVDVLVAVTGPTVQAE